MNYVTCPNCGNVYDAYFTHVCFGRRGQTTYEPNAPGKSSGAKVMPALTEERVREIVREELARTSGVAASAKTGDGGM